MLKGHSCTATLEKTLNRECLSLVATVHAIRPTNPPLRIHRGQVALCTRLDNPSDSFAAVALTFLASGERVEGHCEIFETPFSSLYFGLAAVSTINRLPLDTSLKAFRLVLAV